MNFLVQVSLAGLKECLECLTASQLSNNSGASKKERVDRMCCMFVLAIQQTESNTTSARFEQDFHASSSLRAWCVVSTAGQLWVQRLLG